jgi:hypothetical protein
MQDPEAHAVRLTVSYPVWSTAMLPSTPERVPSHTDANINARIEQETLAAVATAAAGGPDRIADRIRTLDRSWDIERAIEANASSLVLVGLALGLFVHRRFLWLPAAVGAFLLQHALQGWCPPVPVLRRLGFRTQSEIERERAALKALRGDFDAIGRRSGSPDAAREALDAASR